MSERKRKLILLLVAVALVLGTGSTASGAWYEKYGIRKYELASPSSIPKLEAALKDRDGDVRKAALKALADLGSAAREAVPAIVAMLKDVHPNVRAQAVDTLGYMGAAGQEAAPALLPVLADRDADLRLKVLQTLKRLGYRGDDLQAALRQMAANDPHRRVKNEAAAMLARFGQQSPASARPDSRDAVPARPAPAARPAAPAAAASPVAAPIPAATGGRFDLPRTESVNLHGIAVIIGNRNYAAAGKNVPDVDYAHNDADLVYNFVTKSLGYREGNVIYLKDATMADLVSVFGNSRSHSGRLFDYVRPDQSDLFVYYSGHGAPGLEDGTGFLLPVDTDPRKVELNGFPIQVLYENLAKIPAKTKTVVIDACFSGASPGGNLVQNASSISLKLKEVHPVDQGTTLLTAAGVSEVASWDQEAKHGLFTRYFIEGVAGKADQDAQYGNRDGLVTLDELTKYIKGEVAYTSRRLYGRNQNPQLSGSTDIFRTMWADIRQQEKIRNEAEQVRRREEQERLKRQKEEEERLAREREAQLAREREERAARAAQEAARARQQAEERQIQLKELERIRQQREEEKRRQEEEKKGRGL